VLTGQHCDPWSSETVRATMGSIFALPLARMDLDAAAALCRSWPGEIVATAMAGTEDFRRAYRAPTLLMLGSEGTGLSPALATLAHATVRIPMADGPESLNVAMAAAVMTYRILHS
jgi:RNA methyltransferase, TrmH family